MAKRPYAKCRGCGALAVEKSISTRGWCYDCGIGTGLETTRQLHAHSGPAYNLWQARQAAGTARYLERLAASAAEAAERQNQTDVA